MYPFLLITRPPSSLNIIDIIWLLKKERKKETWLIYKKPSCTHWFGQGGGSHQVTAFKRIGLPPITFLEDGHLASTWISPLKRTLVYTSHMIKISLLWDTSPSISGMDPAIHDYIPCGPYCCYWVRDGHLSQNCVPNGCNNIYKSPWGRRWAQCIQRTERKRMWLESRVV